MKKVIIHTVLFSALILVSSTKVSADTYMTLPDLMNSRMFSTDGARPLMNLERTQYNNSQIMMIEDKNNPRKQQEQEMTAKQVTDSLPQEKTKFRDYFKNFVVEW